MLDWRMILPHKWRHKYIYIHMYILSQPAKSQIDYRFQIYIYIQRDPHSGFSQKIIGHRMSQKLRPGDGAFGTSWRAVNKDAPCGWVSIGAVYLIGKLL